MRAVTIFQRQSWRGRGLLLCPLLVVLFCQPARAERDKRIDGRQAAIADCSACHRVTRQQKPPAPVTDPDEATTVTAPGFDIIAHRYRGRPRALAQVIRAPRHPMREQQFIPEELKAIVDYIESLRRERW